MAGGSGMNLLFQQTLGIREDGKCVHHPQELVYNKDNDELRPCSCCHLERGKRTVNSRLSGEYSSVSTHLQLRSPVISSSLGEGEGVGEEQKEDGLEQEQQQQQPSQVKKLTEAVLRRWSQVAVHQSLPVEPKTLQDPATSASPDVMEQLCELQLKVERQETVIKASQASIEQLQQTLREQHQSTQLMLQGILQAVQRQPIPKAAQPAEQPRRQLSRRQLFSSSKANDANTSTRSVDPQVSLSVSRHDVPNTSETDDINIGDNSSSDSQVSRNTPNPVDVPLASPTRRPSVKLNLQPLDIILEDSSHSPTSEVPSSDEIPVNKQPKQPTSTSSKEGGDSAPSKSHQSPEWTERKPEKKEAATSSGPVYPEIIAEADNMVHFSCITIDSALDFLDEEEEEESPGDEDDQCDPADFERVTNYKVTDMYGDEGLYTGTLAPNNTPSGFGSMAYDSGRFYKGEWKNGRWNGNGTLLNGNGDSYQGGFLQDARHGKGIYRFTSGDVYEGEFMNDHRHGKGIFRFHNGSIYEGEFRFGSFEGEGKYQFESGTYEGTWKSDGYHGLGRLEYKDGSSYRGKFKRGAAHGYGEEKLADGTVRKGLWKKGDFQKDCSFHGSLQPRTATKS